MDLKCPICESKLEEVTVPASITAEYVVKHGNIVCENETYVHAQVDGYNIGFKRRDQNHLQVTAVAA